MLSRQNFSLFPVNEIKDPDKALLISASTDNAPNLSDLMRQRFCKGPYRLFKNA